nr:hypothetical protein [Tanacetum cinerariifolium]
MDSNPNNENDQWKLSLDTDDSDIQLTPILRPSSSTCVETSSSTQSPVRIIPDPVGIIQAAKLLKQRDILLGLDGALDNESYKAEMYMLHNTSQRKELALLQIEFADMKNQMQ